MLGLPIAIHRFRPKAIWYVVSDLPHRHDTGSNSRQAEAVDRFAEWLTKLTVEKEVANGMGGGAGKAKIVLCGHRCVSYRAIEYSIDIRYLVWEVSLQRTR
jgi:hypothetical protein